MSAFAELAHRTAKPGECIEVIMTASSILKAGSEAKSFLEEGKEREA